MQPDRRWTPADRDAAAVAIRDAQLAGGGCHRQAEAVLDAVAPLIAARVRAQVAEEIAAALETHKRRSGGQPPATTILREAGAIARTHATTTEGTDHG